MNRWWSRVLFFLAGAAAGAIAGAVFGGAVFGGAGGEPTVGEPTESGPTASGPTASGPATTEAAPPPTGIRLRDVARDVGLDTIVARGNFDQLAERVERDCAAWEAATELPSNPALIGMRRCEINPTSLMSLGVGLALGDFDNDGDDDLYVPSPAPPGPDARNRMFRNDREAGFVDVTDQSGTAGNDWSLGATFVDVDGDGWRDLYVTNFGPNRLYRNRGDGTFEEVPDAGGAAEPVNSAAATFGDIDQDGDLDLFVANASDFEPEGELPDQQYPFGLPGLRNALYFNQGDGTFVKRRDPWVIERSRFISLGAVFFDMDRDGDPDLFVTNDGTTDDLFVNLGGGVFAHASEQAGAFDQMAGMGIAVGDLNEDRFPDIFISHWNQETDTLLLSTGIPFDPKDWSMRPRFRNVTCEAGLFTPSIGKVGWGAWFADLDLDGDLDLVQAHNYTGAPSPEERAQPNAVHENLGLGIFRDVSEQSGANAGGGGASYGLATSDFDLDGDLDVFIANIEAPIMVLRNDSKRGNSVTLRLRMREGNRFAIGAGVTVFVGDHARAYQVLLGGSYLSSGTTDLVIGLGEATRADRVLVRWPDRSVEEAFGPLAAGQIHVIEPRRDAPL